REQADGADGEPQPGSPAGVQEVGAAVEELRGAAQAAVHHHRRMTRSGARGKLAVVANRYVRADLRGGQAVARVDIGGTWVGRYGYDEELLDEVPPPVVFTLVARVGWFGRFRGTIQDDPVAGNPDEAAVRGWVTERTVEFRKQYPMFYMFLRGER